MFHRVYRAGFVLGLALALHLLVGARVAPAAPKPPAVQVPRGHNQGNLAITQKDVEIQTIDEVVVRRARMKEVYDQNGKVRQPTPEERRAAKGNPSTPGYQADANELKNGQVVKLTLLKKKSDSKSSSSKDQEKDAAKEDKTQWLSAGSITVVLKNYQDSSNTVTFSVDAATLAGNHHLRNYSTDTNNNKKNKDNKVTLDDFRVKMIEIMKEPPDDTKTKKNSK